jgi:hypothetical protein
LGSVAAPGECVGAPTDGREPSRGRFRTASHGISEACEAAQEARANVDRHIGWQKSWRRNRIAFPHTDPRERFNCLEICAADAFGQRPMSKEIS